MDGRGVNVFFRYGGRAGESVDVCVVMKEEDRLMRIVDAKHALAKVLGVAVGCLVLQRNGREVNDYEQIKMVSFQQPILYLDYVFKVAAKVLVEMRFVNDECRFVHRLEVDPLMDVTGVARMLSRIVNLEENQVEMFHDSKQLTRGTLVANHIPRLEDAGVIDVFFLVDFSDVKFLKFSFGYDLLVFFCRDHDIEEMQKQLSRRVRLDAFEVRDKDGGVVEDPFSYTGQMLVGEKAEKVRVIELRRSGAPPIHLVVNPLTKVSDLKRVVRASQCNPSTVCWFRLLSMHRGPVEWYANGKVLDDDETICSLGGEELVLTDGSKEITVETGFGPLILDVSAHMTALDLIALFKSEYVKHRARWWPNCVRTNRFVDDDFALFVDGKKIDHGFDMNWKGDWKVDVFWAYRFLFPGDLERNIFIPWYIQQNHLLNYLCDNALPAEFKGRASDMTIELHGDGKVCDSVPPYEMIEVGFGHHHATGRFTATISEWGDVGEPQNLVLQFELSGDAPKYIGSDVLVAKLQRKLQLHSPCFDIFLFGVRVRRDMTLVTSIPEWVHFHVRKWPSYHYSFEDAGELDHSGVVFFEENQTVRDVVQYFRVRYAKYPSDTVSVVFHERILKDSDELFYNVVSCGSEICVLRSPSDVLSPNSISGSYRCRTGFTIRFILNHRYTIDQHVTGTSTICKELERLASRLSIDHGELSILNKEWQDDNVLRWDSIKKDIIELDVHCSCSLSHSSLEASHVTIEFCDGEKDTISQLTLELDKPMIEQLPRGELGSYTLRFGDTGPEIDTNMTVADLNIGPGTKVTRRPAIRAHISRQSFDWDGPPRLTVLQALNVDSVTCKSEILWELRRRIKKKDPSACVYREGDDETMFRVQYKPHQTAAQWMVLDDESLPHLVTDTSCKDGIDICVSKGHRFFLFGQEDLGVYYGKRRDVQKELLANETVKKELTQMFGDQYNHEKLCFVNGSLDTLTIDGSDPVNVGIICERTYFITDVRFSIGTKDLKDEMRTASWCRVATAKAEIAGSLWPGCREKASQVYLFEKKGSSAPFQVDDVQLVCGHEITNEMFAREREIIVRVKKEYQIQIGNGESRKEQFYTDQLVCRTLTEKYGKADVLCKGVIIDASTRFGQLCSHFLTFGKFQKFVQLHFVYNKVQYYPEFVASMPIHEACVRFCINYAAKTPFPREWFWIDKVTRNDQEVRVTPEASVDTIETDNLIFHCTSPDLQGYLLDSTAIADLRPFDASAHIDSQSPSHNIYHTCITSKRNGMRETAFVKEWRRDNTVTTDPNMHYLSLREISCYARLHHPAIVDFFGYYFVMNHNYFERIYVFTRLMPMSLRQRMLRPDPLSATKRTIIAYEIALALQMIHAEGFVYRDLKTNNVLLDENDRVKLCDFGLSKDTSVTTVYNSISSAAFCDNQYSDDWQNLFLIDIYALGKMLAALADPKEPLPSDLKQLIKRCQGNVQDRPTCAEIARAIANNESLRYPHTDHDLFTRTINHLTCQIL